MAAAAHVLVLPWPLQGHINCMLYFATGLAGAGVHVTFLHTEHNLRRLAGAPSSAAASPRLRFLSVPDGLPDDHPRSVDSLLELAASMLATSTGAYRSLLSSLSSASDAVVGGFPPVTCVVADGLMAWAIDIAEELGVPALAFRTASACSFLAYLSVPDLLESGELPFPASGGGGLDEPVRGVPGTEGFLRRRDLPIQCRRRRSDSDDVDPMLRTLVDLTVQSRKARALILNTAASLEHAALAHIAPHMRDVFAIGPLHAMHPTPSGSLWREDDGCMAWLDAQADRSVVYFLSGLVAAGYPFLWVLRPDMVGVSQATVLQEVARATGNGEQARVVAWAPQRDVLRHRAVGCFLTHAGWNSTLEAVVEGVPMVCWPFFADQQINSRFVGAVWRNGLDMKDVCEREAVERTVREAMESDEIRRSAEALAQQVKRDIAAGGSSATEFQRLVGFIREPGINQ
ncbi:unnamed protein product [Urochloa decumbens]|uniref:Glycosyltransferase n=1 Tax=Urochloa decumbens TaxID=240449 RepID=A0ABC9EUD4_9POAL